MARRNFHCLRDCFMSRRCTCIEGKVEAVMPMMIRTCLSFILVVGLSGCVGWDGIGMRQRGEYPVGNLTSEQREQLRSAAASGESDLIATAARMAWDKPDDAVSLGNYAANLIPERAEEIAAAVTNAVRR